MSVQTTTTTDIPTGQIGSAMMKRSRDWPLILGVLAGAFVGAVARVTSATVLGLGCRLDTSCSVGVYWSCSLPVQIIWAVEGVLMGAFLGAIAVSLLRAMKRRSILDERHGA